MKNPYYLYWVDSIVSSKKYKSGLNDWKITIFVTNTLCNSMIIGTIYLWLKYFGIFPYDLIDFKLSNIRMINGFLNFTIQIASPFILINYFFILYKSRYKKLIAKYSNGKPRISVLINLISLWVGFISLILYSVLT